MSARQPTASERLDRLEAAIERLAGVVANAVTVQAPAPSGSSKAAEPTKTFYTKDEIAAGGGFACEVDPACTKRTKTQKRATIHDDGADGHRAVIPAA